ncbi:PD40 domain-containing protein, partial [bacterium]|nr:PD40 domain-containing protein [bacterium]
DARRLTAHEAYDSHPVISPDGRWVAFESDRYGDADVFLMPIEGGVPRRLTHAGGGDSPRAFSADGKEVLFASVRPFVYPGGAQIWRVPVEGGQPFRLMETFGAEIAPLGDRGYVFAEGRVANGRQHYRGSYQRELWRWSPGGEPVRLTENRGYDTDPMVGADGRIYWLGDMDDSKTANVWVMNADGGGKTQVTKFKGDPVRQADLGGGRLVLERGTSLLVMDLPDGKPREISIRVADDQVENPVVLETKSGDATELAVSDDGAEYALAISGEVVLVSQELGGRAVVCAEGPWLEQSLSFRPGSADTLLLVSDREGEDAVYILVSDDEEESNLRLASKRRLVRLTKGDEPCHDPAWSPKGDRILYTRGNGDLRIMDADGGNDDELSPGWNVDSYAWSPDGKWVAFSRSDRNYNSDVWLIPADGGEARNVTMHPDYDENPVWSADGRVLAWESPRHDHAPDTRNTDVFAVYLRQEDHERSKEEWELWQKTRDKKKDKKGKKDDDEKKDGEKKDEKKDAKDEEKKDEGPEVVIDFDEIHLRARRVTSLDGVERTVAVDPKGDWYYFTAGDGRERDLYRVNRFGEEKEEVTKGGTGPSAITLTADGKTVHFLQRGKPKSQAVKGGKAEGPEFTARLTIDRPAVRERVLDEAWRTMRDRFYDPDMHGVDWKKMRQKYGAMVRSVRHDRDFSDVMNFMLGELNASHMGYRANWPETGEYAQDGWLGVSLDPGHRGRGLRVTDVIPDGPADKERGRILPGDVILSVEGAEVGRDASLEAALENRQDVPTLVRVSRDGEELDLTLTPEGIRPLWQLEYMRMEKDNRAAVESASKGRVGYVHIQGMGFDEVERFEQNLFAAADGKEALIIDVRNNGGGWTTDLMLTILTQPQHAYTIGRDGEVGYPMTERMPFYSWQKPIAVICNEGSYSNAEIFSSAVRTIGRGPVVGMETGGNVISTGGFGNRYNGFTRLPGRGWYTFGDEAHPERNHKPQEGEHDLPGVIPDHQVPRTVADVMFDRDPQLDKAVELMLEAAAPERRKPRAEDSPHLKR